MWYQLRFTGRANSRFGDGFAEIDFKGSPHCPGQSGFVVHDPTRHNTLRTPSGKDLQSTVARCRSESQKTAAAELIWYRCHQGWMSGPSVKSWIEVVPVGFDPRWNKRRKRSNDKAPRMVSRNEAAEPPARLG